jgi:peptide/nickel transport system permease protein
MAEDVLQPEQTQPVPILGSVLRFTRQSLRYARRQPLGAFGIVLVAVFLFMAIFSPWLVRHDPTKTIAPPLLSPSSDYWFGTDAVGRDVFSRTIAGSQISLAVAMTVITINVIFSTILGLWAGYYLGVVDYIIQRSGEIWSAFPFLIALLLIITLLGPPSTGSGNFFLVSWELRNLIFAFSLGAVFGGSRVVRGVVISLKEQDYVLAARALGAGDERIILKHILPNVMPYVIITATAGVTVVILGEAALSFLGFGIAPPTPSWGQDLSGRNRSFFREALWVALAPGTAISLTVLGFGLFGDAMRDILDPRLRGSRGRV